NRTRYLSEIAENNRGYDAKAKTQKEVAQKLYGIYKTIETISGKIPVLTQHGIEINGTENAELAKILLAEFDKLKRDLDPYNWEVITTCDEKVNRSEERRVGKECRD